MPKLEIIRKEALEFLYNNPTAVVATVGNGMPFASTVYYIIDESFNMYFATEIDTNKYKNILANGKASYVVGTGPSHISITGQGTAHEIKGEEREAVFDRILDLMLRHHIKRTPVDEMVKAKEKKLAVFKITPQKLTFMNLDDESYPGSISNKYISFNP